jgi:hypothetical protein
MCTVSFFYKGAKDFILTSNRDEAIGRSTLPPHVITFDAVAMLMPKDEVAGGTWIGASEKDRLICLLNGGFVKHARKSHYRKSRGLVVKELLAVDDLLGTLEAYDFNGIEPFTLIVVDWSQNLKLYELVWDELQAHFSELPLTPRIWCSATLYDDEMKKIRNSWFLDFQNKHKMSQLDILDFHENFGVGDKNIDLQIDRGLLKTVSITSFNKNSDAVNSIYRDLLLKENFVNRLAANSLIDG